MMNKRNKNLESRKRFLTKRIEHIKNLQNNLMLKNILLSSMRKELEFKKSKVERLLSYRAPKPIARKQIIAIQINNPALPWELYMN